MFEGREVLNTLEVVAADRSSLKGAMSLAFQNGDMKNAHSYMEHSDKGLVFYSKRTMKNIETIPFLHPLGYEAATDFAFNWLVGKKGTKELSGSQKWKLKSESYYTEDGSVLVTCILKPFGDNENAE